MRALLTRRRRRVRLHSAAVAAALFGTLSLAGCATGPGNPGNVPPQRRDPLAPMNREVYRFNNLVDSALIRPLAKGYVRVTPRPVRTSISNFFSNLELPVTIVNDLLQLKPIDAVRDTGRFFANSTLGIAGLFDPASSWGLVPHSEDFGITLARWGVPSGPYLVIPFFGPSDVRDALGLYVDYFGSAYQWTGWHPGTRNAVFALQVVSLRAQFLNYDQLLEQAYDPYAFMRNAYLQSRDQTIRKNLPNYNPNQLPNYEKMLNSGGDGPPH